MSEEQSRWERPRRAHQDAVQHSGNWWVGYCLAAAMKQRRLSREQHGNLGIGRTERKSQGKEGMGGSKL